MFDRVSYLIFLSIPMNSGCVAENQIMSNGVGLGGGVPLTAVAKCLGASPRCKEPVVVP